jgi:hypothetical protein
VRDRSTVGRVRWSVRRDARAEHRALRKLGQYHGQLCVASPDARRRRAATAVSREGFWNHCIFCCSRPAHTGEPRAVGNSRRSGVSDTFCRRRCVDVSEAPLCTGAASSLVPDFLQRYCIRVCRSCNPADVHRHWTNDPAHRPGRRCHWACPYSMGTFQSASAYAGPGNKYCGQANLD